MIFYSHANKTHFYKKGCALRLILKVRVFGTLKWPIIPLPNGRGPNVKVIFQEKGRGHFLGIPRSNPKDKPKIWEMSS